MSARLFQTWLFARVSFIGWGDAYRRFAGKSHACVEGERTDAPLGRGRIRPVGMGTFKGGVHLPPLVPPIAKASKADDSSLVPIPSRFFVTSGRAINKTSELNAFDLALLKAGIGEQNLVSVSSILPNGIKQIERKPIPMGAVTHCVLARHAGGEGEVISAGIAYAFRADGRGGYVAEGHLHGTQKALKEFLRWRMEEIAHFRGVELLKINYRTEELSIPMDHYGVCIAACVFLR